MSGKRPPLAWLYTGYSIHFWLGGSIFGAKNMFFVHFYTSSSSYSSSTTKILLAPYLPNRLELNTHILTQGRCEALDVPIGGLVDFGLGGSIFGQKTTFLVTILVRAVSLEPLGVES